MATTKDLSELIDREMGKGQGPFLVRICQDADILPRVKRGGWRAMAELTPEHLADFIMALAGTRAAGERNARSARAGVDRFADLVMESHGKSTVREDLATVIRGGVREDKIVRWMLFINHPTSPEVELRLYSETTDSQEARNYNNPGNELADRTADAFMIYGDLLRELSELLTADVADPVA